jgi:ATP-binding cassette subfamily B protein
LAIKPTHKRAFKLARTFISPYKKAVAGALAALIFTAGVTLGLGQGLRILVDQGLATQSPAMLSQSIGLFFVLVIALAFGSFARFYLVSWIGERVIADIRKQVFNHLIDLHPGFMSRIAAWRSSPGLPRTRPCCNRLSVPPFPLLCVTA